jgi:hypothetical protein
MVGFANGSVGGGGSRKVSGLFSYPHTCSKNPPPISGMQAYIAYLFNRLVFEDRF